MSLGLLYLATRVRFQHHTLYFIFRLKKIIQSIAAIFSDMRKQGSFAQNSAWMFSSTGISIVIQMVFFVLLARIYPPEVYGLFGVFNVYIGVLGNAATWGYTQAFVLPKTDREFSALLKVTLYVSSVFCLLVLFVTFIAGENILRLFKHEQLGLWMYAIAPISMLMSLDRIVSDWAIRNKEFKQQMIWSTSTTFVSKAFNVFYGLRIAPTVAGLVVTTAVQYVLRVAGYARFALVDFKERLQQKTTRAEMREVMQEYRDYPIYIHWGNVINIFSNNLPAALLPLLGFTLADVGYYSNSLILLDLPIRMLGAGISAVFMQKAAELVRHRRHELATHTWRLYKNILFVSLLFMMVVMLLGEPLYTLFLGNNWSTAGRAAEVLIIFYFFRMISAPLSALFNVLRKEKESFIFQVVLAAARIGGLFIGALYTTDFIQLMWIYTIINAVLYFVYCIWIFKLIEYPIAKASAITLGGFGAVLAVVYVLRILVF
jgi:O-antigen/teichoic acid export membrane protein